MTDTVVLDGGSVVLGENAFFGCEGLVDVKNCEERDESTVEIDDRAENLEKGYE